MRYVEGRCPQCGRCCAVVRFVGAEREERENIAKLVTAGLTVRLVETDSHTVTVMQHDERCPRHPNVEGYANRRENR